MTRQHPGALGGEIGYRIIDGAAHHGDRATVPFSFAFATEVGEDHGVTSAEETTSWFAVRCLFEWSGPGSMKRRVYEERLVLCVMVPVVAFSSPAVTGEQGTVDCGPTLSAIFLIFPSDPAPGEAWAIEPCNAALGARWLLMLALAGVGAALLWFGREKPVRHVVLPPLGG